MATGPGSICPQCGAANRPGAKFCSRCGQTLAGKTCPHCGQLVTRREPDFASAAGWLSTPRPRSLLSRRTLDRSSPGKPLHRPSEPPPPREAPAPEGPAPLSVTPVPPAPALTSRAPAQPTPPAARMQEPPPMPATPTPAALKLTCPECGGPVGPGARFCRTCVADLVKPVAPRPPGVQPPARPSAVQGPSRPPVAQPLPQVRPRQDTRASIAGLVLTLVIAAVFVVVLSFVPIVRERVPVFATINSALENGFQRAWGLGKSLVARRSPQEQPSSQQNVPASQVTAQPTNSPSPPPPSATSPPSPSAWARPSESHRAPQEARVLLDGTLAGTAELMLKDVQPGKHVIKISKSGFLPVTRAIRVHNRT